MSDLEPKLRALFSEAAPTAGFEQRLELRLAAALEHERRVDLAPARAAAMREHADQAQAAHRQLRSSILGSVAAGATALLGVAATTGFWEAIGSQWVQGIASLARSPPALVSLLGIGALLFAARLMPPNEISCTLIMPGR